MKDKREDIIDIEKFPVVPEGKAIPEYDFVIVYGESTGSKAQ